MRKNTCICFFFLWKQLEHSDDNISIDVVVQLFSIIVPFLLWIFFLRTEVLDHYNAIHWIQAWKQFKVVCTLFEFRTVQSFWRNWYILTLLSFAYIFILNVNKDRHTEVSIVSGQLAFSFVWDHVSNWADGNIVKKTHGDIKMHL